ncbi:MAG TPA: GH3 auxin-responsive promoter family protein [Dehalococcoidales bacterium]|nr:GH3 auxin-responsive promoter family protein [Dehalococcoidales bacterium]
MMALRDLFQFGNHEELWQRCCGFIDLKLSEFMTIQERLLKEQLVLLKKCELGRSILGTANPETINEFRDQVPLTTYENYAPYLTKRRMDVLPRKPILWQYTSGKYGEYQHRWAPVTARQLEEIEPLIMALVLFSGSKKKNEVAFQLHDKVFYGMAPPPYATGTLARAFPNGLFDFLPPINQAEDAPFEERIQQGFKMALSEGLDICLAMSSVTVAIGNRFAQKSSGGSMTSMLKKPEVLSRFAKGYLKSKMAHRHLMPKDIWSLKGLITFGIDSSIYREKIKDMWGRYPLEFHGCTEAPLIAMQTWDYTGMTFVPQLNFFEFIPEKESILSRQNPNYQPSTLLMDELKPGNYELVVTSFHGGPFIRYRLGHLVKIMSLRNEALGIDIPQMEFLTRVDDQIDIAGFTRLSEKAIWQSIENTGISYENWVARKESNGTPALHIYIEMKNNGHVSGSELTHRIHEELKKIDTPYAELESFTGLKPLAVTMLPEGSFQMYKQRLQELGADVSQLRPPHINPSNEIVEFLLNPTVVQPARREQTTVA